MKNVFFIICLMLKLTPLLAQSFEWVKSVGGPNDQYGRSIAIDATGNIYITGTFTDTVDFDPGVGVTNLPSAGLIDIFIQKLDPAGNFIWAKSFGGPQSEGEPSLDVDPNGNVYISGAFYGTIDFDPGSGVEELTSNGALDIFVQKLDAGGNFVWANSFGGTNNDQPLSIKVDDLGCVYTTGIFKNNVDFDPGVGNTVLNSNNSTIDIFVQKMNSSGNFVWARTFGGTNNDSGYSTTIDNFGHLYTTGYFRNVVDFDPGPAISTLSASGENENVFIQKLDTSGLFIWARSFGGTDLDVGYDIVTDDNGNIYTTGEFNYTVDFDSDIGVYNLSSNGNSDVFVHKMDSSGNFVWAKTFGGTYHDYSISLDLDPFGNVYTCGQFQDTAEFNPGTGTALIASNGSDDIFMQKMNSDGLFIWAKTIGNSDYDISGKLKIDNSGNIYSTGAFRNTVDFDSGTGIENLNSLAEIDIFILKLSPCNTTPGTHFVTACDSFTWIDGITYNASTYTPTWTLQNVNGCDSVITLNLTIHPSTMGVDYQTACDSLTWIDGVTYYSSTNQPTWILQNSNGCDSTVTLNLSIVSQLQTIIENTFSLPSSQLTCNGSFAINVSGIPDFVIEMNTTTQTTNSYGFFNNLCPGVHDVTIENFCGSTISSQFVIPIDSNYVFNNPFIDSLAQDSIGVTLNNCEIYYNNIDTAYIDSIWAVGNNVNVIWNIVDSNGSNYDTSSYILNNGSGVYWLQLSIFCPTRAVGDYFVVSESIYFENGNVSTSNLSEYNDFNFQIYPNPTDNLLTITFDCIEADLVIYDTHGKILYDATIKSHQQVNISTFEVGVYFLEISSDKFNHSKLILKN